LVPRAEAPDHGLLINLRGRLLSQPALEIVTARYATTPVQVALAWLLRPDGLIVIPRAGTPEHVRENRASLHLRLTRRDLTDLDRAFPLRTAKRPLEIL
jgi:diketogulonate reductase-like aldo/keto reductase